MGGGNSQKESKSPLARQELHRSVLLMFSWVLIVGSVAWMDMAAGHSRKASVNGVGYALATAVEAGIGVGKNNFPVVSDGNERIPRSRAGGVIPTITLGKDKDGKRVNMPLLGAGTWMYNDDEARDSLCQSFYAGYTMVDTAFGYANMKGVGEAIKTCWLEPRKREDLFILTKVHGGASYNFTMEMHQQNLDGMGVDYADLLIVHFPADWAQTITGKEQRQAQWKALEELYRQGKARSIGVSHYCGHHIDDILEIATVRPVLNQVEYHLGANKKAQRELLEKCTKENMYMMSFSPLDGPRLQSQKTNWFDEDDVLRSLGEKYGKTAAQVSLRYIVQQAIEDNGLNMAGVIPKSSNPIHVKENREIFDFELTKEEMDKLGAFPERPGWGDDCRVL